MDKIRRILISGDPGIGKTTIVRKISLILEDKNIDFRGIYTQEVRKDGNRVGFDVINIKTGEKQPMASVARGLRGPKVGKYTVNVEAFESVALDALQPPSDCTSNIVYFIDEIGKMELFSEQFRKTVKKLFSLESENLKIVATIPIIRSIPEVEVIRRLKYTEEVVVTNRNRDTLANHVLNILNVHNVK